jgi:hypothetical protein
MLLGRKAGSEASVGRKPQERVSFQECPGGRCVMSSFDPNMSIFKGIVVCCFEIHDNVAPAWIEITKHDDKN